MKNQQPYRSHSRRRLLIHACWAAAAVLLLALMTPMLVGHVYVADDLGAYHLPARAFYAKCLAAGDRFDWWPDLFGGIYLTGEGQAGTYHPLHFALYRFLPLSLAFGLEICLSYPLMLAGMYLWLKRRLRRRDAAVFGAIVFAFSGFNLLHLMHVNAIAVIAHIPWILWLTDVALTDRQPRRAAWALLGVALLVGSQILLGYPQYVWFSLLAQGLYALVAPRRQPLLPVAGALLTGLIIGSVQWLPTAEALQASVRQSVDGSFAAWGSLHPLNFIQLLAPYLFEHRVVGQNTHELGLYIGAVPLTLVAWLALRRVRMTGSRPLVTYSILLGLLASLMALGSFGFLYPLQTWLPVVGKFRFPCRMIVLLHLALAILSAVAVGTLLRYPRRADGAATRSPNALWAVAGASVLISAVSVFLWPENVADRWLILAGPALFTTACWLVLSAERGHGWAVLGVVVLTAADLGIYGLSYSVIDRTAPLQTFADEVDRPSTVGGRVMIGLQHREQGVRQTGNRILLAGYSRIGGYMGLVPRRQLDYRNEKVLRLASVNWLAVGDAESAPEQNNNSGHGFRRLAESLPPLRLVSRAECWQQPQQGIDAVDIRTTAVVQRPLELPLSDPGTVRVVSNKPGVLHCDTQTADRQLLIVAQNFHPGWKATIDDCPVSVWRVYGDFMGCVVPAGRHAVRLEFRPDSQRTGRTLTLCGLGLMLCGFLATLQRTRS